MQVARSGVVAEPGPFAQHVVERGGRQIRDTRPALQEALEIAGDGGNRRLLQHDFAEPDMVGIGPDAGRGAPGQRAAMMVVPAQQPGRQGRRFIVVPKAVLGHPSPLCSGARVHDSSGRGAA